MDTNERDDHRDSDEFADAPDDEGATPSERARGKIGDASGTVKPAVGDVQRAIPDAPDDVYWLRAERSSAVRSLDGPRTAVVLRLGVLELRDTPALRRSLGDERLDGVEIGVEIVAARRHHADHGAEQRHVVAERAGRADDRDVAARLVVAEDRLQPSSAIAARPSSSLPSNP